MSSKKLTRTQSVQEKKRQQIAAIEKMLVYVLKGAHGGYSNEEWNDSSMLGMDSFGRFYGALIEHILPSKLDEFSLEIISRTTKIENFQSLDELAKKLWDLGYRE